MIRIISLFISLFLITNCTTTKKVYICGDHECVNKAEAKQYFNENLNLEIKIINKNSVKSYDLVQLNRKNSTENQTNTVTSTKEKSKIKKLNAEEKKTKKEEVNKNIKFEKLKKIKEKKLAKKKDGNNLFKRIINKKDSNNIITKNDDVVAVKTKKNTLDSINKKPKKMIDKVKNVKIYTSEICPILNKCDIDSITNYLVKKGKEKNYPDISGRNK